MIRLQKKSTLTGKVNSMELPVTQKELIDYYSRKSGLIHQAFPNLSSDQREFILSGITPLEWEIAFCNNKQCGHKTEEVPLTLVQL